MKDTHQLSREIVYDRIRKNPGVSNQDLERMLGWTINRITPRTKELLDAGLIEVIGHKKTVFGCTTRCYAAKGVRPL